MTKDYRLEHDAVGPLEIPVDAYYGVQSLRAKHNFFITGQHLLPEVICALAEVKKAAALVNAEAKSLAQDKADAICQACDEIIAGKWHDAFICDPVQGGAGTSANMNANEVIANRANEIMGGTLGSYDKVHPNDHVNMSQSTNDVYPTAGKMAAARLLDQMLERLTALREALQEKDKEFDDVIKVGRTQLQDAVPMRLGQGFGAYAAALGRDIKRLQDEREVFLECNMGGTAIGTGINASGYYMDHIGERLAEVSGLPISIADNLFDGTQNLDRLVVLSGLIKASAVTMSKMSNDLRLLSSGPRTGMVELILPARQNGSSIMPGKVNPVIPEVVSQVAFNIIGNDMTISMAAEAGQLELNAFEPVLFYNLYESLQTLGRAAETLHKHCIVGLKANRAHLKDLLEQSLVLTTALCPHVGYAKAAEIAAKAMETGEPLRKLIEENFDYTPEEVDKILDADALTRAAKTVGRRLRGSQK